ncbi:MAG: hypothetical protein R6W93_05970 [Candidatus Limnocylindrales bacterium]
MTFVTFGYWVRIAGHDNDPGGDDETAGSSTETTVSRWVIPRAAGD